MPRPLLESLIQEALASGPDLQIAAARVKEADLRWQATGAGLVEFDFQDHFAEKINSANLSTLAMTPFLDSRPIKFFKYEPCRATKFVAAGKLISSDEMTSAP